jgi:pilus assembly protein CpaE
MGNRKMDTMILEPADFNLRTATAIEPVLRIAAGRLPMMAFVDGPTEQILQESSVLLGRNQIIRGGIAKAIEYLNEQRSPNLLLVDISSVELPLSQIQMLAEVCEPGTNVIAIGDHNDVALYRDLQAAGVTDYLVKPLTRELLTKALTPKANSGEMGKASAALKLGKMVAFAGARGGVGTTTLAANLAWHLANRQSRRVALVDLDLQQGDCALLFNVDTTPGLRDALANPLRLDPLLLDRLMTKHGERLFLLGGEEPIQDHVQFTPGAIDTLFSVLRSQFHYVIADVPRIPIPAYRRALELADRRVIVVDQTMRSMRDAVRLKNTFGDTAGAEQLQHRSIFIVNRVGEAGNHGLDLKEVNSVLQAKPTSTIPFLPKLVTPAAHHATVAARQRKFGNAVGELALEISGRTRKRRWFSRRAK